MDLNSAKRSIAQGLKKAFKPWLALSVLALVAVLASYAVTSNLTGTCSVSVRLKYDGVEAGLDPNGNRFDPADLKNTEIVLLSAQAVDESVEAEDVQRIQDALEISGNVNGGDLDRILTHNSIYGEDKEVAEFHDVETTSYFPTQYQILFRYADAGFTKQQGLSFLDELLNAYKSYFYEKYGYNTSFKQVISSFDYETYDYIDAVDILRSHLSSLRSYLTRLQAQDNTRFVSQTSGYSFSDLLGALDTLETEDIQWITSYITSNNITKNQNQLIDYYQYKIEDAQRALAQQDSRLYTLNDLIESYVKTTAVFPMTGDNRGSQNAASALYEFSQPSQMYDSLINEKVSCQTALSDTREQIALFQNRMERLQSGNSAGNSAIVENRLSALYDKTAQLLENIGLTSDEFFKTVLLKDAVQMLYEPMANSFSIGAAIRNSRPTLLMTESALFGLYVLAAFVSPWLPERFKSVTKENKAGKAVKEKVSK